MISRFCNWSSKATAQGLSCKSTVIYGCKSCCPLEVEVVCSAFHTTNMSS